LVIAVSCVMELITERALNDASYYQNRTGINVKVFVSEDAIRLPKPTR